MRVRIARCAQTAVTTFAGGFLTVHGHVILGVVVAAAGIILSILALP